MVAFGRAQQYRVRIPAAAANPKTTTLTDNFASQDTAKWAGYGGNATVVSGQLNIVCTSSYSAINSVGKYTLADSLISVEVPQVPNQGNGTTSAYLIAVDTLHSGWRAHMAWQGGQIVTGYTNAGGTSDTTTTYNATAHAIWRIRVTGGQMYWETSSNGSSWNTLRGPVAVPVSVTAVQVYLQSGYYGTEPAPGTAKFDNFNATYSDPPPSPRIFYVDPSGSDSNDGLTTGTAWATLTKVTATSMYPGDQILLKRGASFAQNLTIAGSGTALAPITVGAYSTGALPIIDGGGSSGTAGSRKPIEIYGSWVTIDSVEARGSIDNDIYVNGADCTIQNSTIRWGSYGVYQGTGGARLKVLSNTIVDVNVLVAGPGSDDDSGCMGVVLLGDAAEVAYNAISDCWATSADYGIDGSGVDCYGATNANIHHNTVIDCVTMVELGNPATAGIDVHHNVYRSSLSVSAGLIQHGTAPFGPVLGTTFYNNSIYVTGGTTQCYGVWASAGAGLDVRNNIFYVTGSGRMAYIESSGTTLTEAHNVFYGSANITLPAGTIDATSVNADPLFYSSTNLHLQTGSPAIDLGVDLGYTDDFDGVPISGNPDAGAYEYVASTPVSLSETAAGTDAVSAAAAAPLTESVVGADTLAATVAVPLADPRTVSDAVSAVAAVPLADTATASDGVSAASTAALADPRSISDAITTAAAISLPAETGTGTDAVSTTVAVVLTDTAAGTDAVSVARGVFLTDTTAGTDALAAGSVTVPLTETAAGTDAVSVARAASLADTGTGTDTVAATATAALADTGTGTDAISVSGSSSPQLPETGTGTDALSVAATNGLADPRTVTDAVTATATTTLAETGAANDAATASVVATLADTATGLDILAITVSPALSDTATAADGISVVITVALVDTATGSDQVSVVALAVTLTDAALVVDAIAVLTGGTDTVTVWAGPFAYPPTMTLRTYPPTMLTAAHPPRMTVGRH